MAPAPGFRRWKAPRVISPDLRFATKTGGPPSGVPRLVRGPWASDFRTEAVYRTAVSARASTRTGHSLATRGVRTIPIGGKSATTSGRQAGVVGCEAHYPSKGVNRLAGVGALSTWPLSLGRGAAGQWRLSKVAGARGVLVVVRLKEADERHVATPSPLRKGAGLARSAARESVSEATPAVAKPRGSWRPGSSSERSGLSGGRRPELHGGVAWCVALSTKLWSGAAALGSRAR